MSEKTGRSVRTRDVPRLSISIVIPVGGEEPDIVDAVAGALAQGSAVLEVVVVVAGDADAVAQRVAATAVREPRVLLLREARHGRGLACRIGFDAARGDIIAGVGADVRLPPGWADAVVGAFVEHPEADVGGAPQGRGVRGANVAVRASSWPAVRGALGDGGASCTVVLVPAMAETAPDPPSSLIARTVFRRAAKRRAATNRP